MQLTRVLHTGFTVSDMERSIAFYRDKLGMQLVHRQQGTAAYLGTITGFDGVQLDIAFLKVTRDVPHVLELLQYKSHPAPPTDRAANRPGNGHLCFQVDDIQAWYESLTGQGVEAISEPVQITAGINQGSWAVYLRDPDGFTIELVQPAASRSGVDS